MRTDVLPEDRPLSPEDWPDPAEQRYAARQARLADRYVVLEKGEVVARLDVSADTRDPVRELEHHLHV